MKVKLNDRSLWHNFESASSYITGASAFILTFIEFNQEQKTVFLVCCLMMLLFMFVTIWARANTKNVKKIKINNTNLIIKYGDIFKQNGIKVIAFNEFFDTIVDDRIISKNSLNGIYISEYSKGADVIDSVVMSESRLAQNITENNVKRLNGGKTTKYKLGSICPVDDDYFLLAFTHFDKEDRAYISAEDYISCLMHMWNELDRYYAGRYISIPLLGNGITRFNKEMKAQDLLRYIIMTFEISKVKFGNNSSLTIVLSERLKNEINLYNLGGN